MKTQKSASNFKSLNNKNVLKVDFFFPSSCPNFFEKICKTKKKKCWPNL